MAYTVAHDVIFGSATPSGSERPSREVVQFTVSSETDLFEYFRKKWDRQIQVRCAVRGNANGRSYSGFAMGPYNGGMNISLQDPRQGLFQRAFKRAAFGAGVTREATPHTLRHAFATHILQAGYDIRTVQDLLGHADVATTMIYTRVLEVGGGAVRSPIDAILRG